MLGFVESAGLAAVPFGSAPPPVTTLSDVVRRMTQIWADWSAGFKTLANGADLLLTGKGEQGQGANVAEYYGIPHAALHFFPGDHANVGGVMGSLAKQAGGRPPWGCRNHSRRHASRNPHADPVARR